MGFDFKKSQKELYQPGQTPAIVEVPTMRFLMVDGTGDPNTSPAYAAALEALYGISYAIRMNRGLPGWFEYVVAPLEGLWEVDDETFRGGGAPIADKSRLRWTSLIRQPDFVTPAVFEEARGLLEAKKPGLDLSGVRLADYQEGLCAQVMHLGPYDTEPATITRLAEFIQASGYTEDFESGRRHHEIYLGDPRKTEPQKLRTVLRHPVRKLG